VVLADRAGTISFYAIGPDEDASTRFHSPRVERLAVARAVAVVLLISIFLFNWYAAVACVRQSVDHYHGLACKSHEKLHRTY